MRSLGTRHLRAYAAGGVLGAAIALAVRIIFSLLLVVACMVTPFAAFVGWHHFRQRRAAPSQPQPLP